MKVYRGETVTVEMPHKQWTLVIGRDEMGCKWTVGVNGVEWSALPKAEEVKIVNVKVSINDKVISEHGKEWQSSDMQHAILAQIAQEEKITSFKIENVRETTTPVMNEMIGLVAMQENIPEEGLQELVFHSWEYETHPKHLVEPLDDSAMQALVNKSQALTTLKMTTMHNQPENVRINIAHHAASLLAANSNIRHLDFGSFSQHRYGDEDAALLSALASSNSLPTITHFRCSDDYSWFEEGREINVDHLCDAIKAMTSLTYLNLYNSQFSTEASDKVMSAIVANQEQNPNLKDINLVDAAGDYNENFSSSAKEHIAALKAKGLTIAETGDQGDEMNERYHPDEEI